MSKKAMTLRDLSRESRHQEWLAHQAYSQLFTRPSIVWSKLIDNQSHKCRCGCGGVWYGPGGGTNMLAYLFPIVLLRFLKDTKALYPVFRPLCDFLQVAPLLAVSYVYRIWSHLYSPPWSAAYWKPITDHIKSRNWFWAVIGGCVLPPVGIAISAVCITFWIALFGPAWFLRILAPSVVLMLHAISLTLILFLFVSLSTLVAIYVVARGLAFVVAGAASVIYSYHSEIGVVLIVLGLLIEYAFRHRDEKRHKYQLGRIIAHQQSPATTEPTHTD